MTQLALPIPPACKNRCAAPVVGHSITGRGHVCRACNEAEWGSSLAANPDPYYARLGRALLADSRLSGPPASYARAAGGAGTAPRSPCPPRPNHHRP